MERKYNPDIDINNVGILEENLTHASKCQYYGDKLAEAILSRDTAKANLKVIEAELYDELLRTWESIYEKIPSEATRNGWVIRQPKYKKALAIYNKSEYHVNLLKSADEAFKSRGYSLGNVTSILISNFDSVPKVNKVDKYKNQRLEDIKNTKVNMDRSTPKTLRKKLIKTKKG